MILKRKIAKLIIFLVVVTLSSTLKIAQAQAPAPIIPSTIQGQIAYYANIYGSNSQQLLAVAKCESNFNPVAVGDHGYAFSIYQFHRDTFTRFAMLYQSEYGGTLLQYSNPQDQIKLAAYMFSLGQSTRENWTCYRIHYM
jgi:soluble lytic murein transglycosylase-like protein